MNGKLLRVFWMLLVGCLAGCADRVPASPDASVANDLGCATDGGAEPDDASLPPWPDNCPPPAIVGRIRLADGGVHEGCFPSSEGGLTQSYSNCLPSSATLAGESGRWRFGAYKSGVYALLAGTETMFVFYREFEVPGGEYYGGEPGGECRFSFNQPVVLGEDVDFHLTTPCRLPALRDGGASSVVVESMRGRARVELGRQRFDGHDAAARDCGPLR